jgi:hypothetical protein
MPKKLYHYEVSGHGQFPTDMLRYDQARIVSTRPDPDNPRRTLYSIEGSTPPTRGRWASFLWSITKE